MSAIFDRDYPVVMGVVLPRVRSQLLIGNILSDALVAARRSTGEVRYVTCGALDFHRRPRKQWRRFRSIKRGYYSLLAILAILVATLFAELLGEQPRADREVRRRATTSRPMAGIFPATTFGLDYQYETNYRELARSLLRNATPPSSRRPNRPATGCSCRRCRTTRTKPTSGRTRFRRTRRARQALLSAPIRRAATSSRGSCTVFVSRWRSRLILLTCNYVVGIDARLRHGVSGAAAFDLVFQRLIEIWSNVPFLYVIMIIASVIVPNFWTLVAAMVIFGWMEMTWYMRTSTYREKAREYVTAARALGASTPRILFLHILPNTVSIIVTFIPFSIASGVTALTALDYLGFGLPPPTPSWGELLAQGTANLQHPWIVTSVVVAMTAHAVDGGLHRRSDSRSVRSETIHVL